MTYTRRQWAIDLLHAIGNPAPTEPVIDFVAGWTAMETSAGGGASYNLLNTEQQASGSWNFNSAGVQNFPTYAEGVQTNAEMLENGLYNPLLQALQTNDATALGLNGQPPSSGVQRSLTNWVQGPGYTQIDASYVNGVVSLAHSSSVPGQTFPGSQGSVPVASPGASTSGSTSGGSSSSTTGSSSNGWTITNTSTGTDPFGVGAAVNSVENVAAKFFQSATLLLLALVLVAIGLWLLIKHGDEDEGAPASAPASIPASPPPAPKRGGWGKGVNPNVSRGRSAKTPKATPRPARQAPAPKPKPAPATKILKPAPMTRKLPRQSLGGSPKAVPRAAGTSGASGGGAASAAGDTDLLASGGVFI